MKRGIVIFLVFSLIFIIGVSGCPNKYKYECIQACKASQEKLSSECLLNPIPNTDYVCDVSHSPRTQEDNLPENQCSAWRNGTAKHFIEVTPDCEFIRVI